MSVSLSLEFKETKAEIGHTREVKHLLGSDCGYNQQSYFFLIADCRHIFVKFQITYIPTTVEWMVLGIRCVSSTRNLFYYTGLDCVNITSRVKNVKSFFSASITGSQANIKCN